MDVVNTWKRVAKENKVEPDEDDEDQESVDSLEKNIRSIELEHRMSLNAEKAKFQLGNDEQNQSKEGIKSANNSQQVVLTNKDSHLQQIRTSVAVESLNEMNVVSIPGSQACNDSTRKSMKRNGSAKNSQNVILSFNESANSHHDINQYHSIVPSAKQSVQLKSSLIHS
jgi:hypothetical protein